MFPETPPQQSPPRARLVIAAGLGQILLLLLAFWSLRPWSLRPDFLLSASLLGLSLLPVGFSVRLGWLRFGALAWWVLFLVLSWQNGRGGMAGPVHPLGILCFVLAVFAAAAGHWLQLDQLRLGRLAAVLRILTQLLIGFCLLMLVLMVSGMGLVVVFALFYGTVAAMGLSLLTHLLAVLGAVRGDGVTTVH